MRTTLIPLMALCLGLLGGGELRAAENKDAQAMVKELKKISARARKERSADRWLLQSLDDLVSKYDWPWTTTLVEEDFSDGDFDRDPVWKVASGEFWVDASVGLRSRVSAAAPEKAEPEERSEEDLGKALVGSLLKGFLGSSQRKPAAPAKRRQAGPAEIYLPKTFRNAFALKVVFSIHNAPSQSGELVFSVYQGKGRRSGYRLTIGAGEEPSLELTSVRSGRSSVIDRKELRGGEADGRPHTLEWRRDAKGGMAVLLDGRTLLSAGDRAFKGSFGGFGIINRGGDYGVRGISISQ